MIKTLFKAGRDPAPLPVIPPYAPGTFGRWRVEPIPPGPLPGYFNFTAATSGSFVLQERHKTLNRWRPWMGLTPAEQEAQIIPLEEAHGHVVIAGLGLGMAAYNIAMKPEVTRVTVIENDRRITRMLRECARWGDWPGAGKISVYMGDALGWTPDMRPLPEQRFPDASAEELEAMMARFAWTDVDLLYVDLWTTPGTLTALSDVSLIAANLGPAAVYYHGQEFDITQRYADRRRADPSIQMSREILADWIERTNLPMIGLDWPNYHAHCPEVVRNHYRRSAMARKPESKGKAA